MKSSKFLIKKNKIKTNQFIITLIVLLTLVEHAIAFYLNVCKSVILRCHLLDDNLQVKKEMDDRAILQFVHGLYHDLGIQELTVQTDDA